MSILTGLLLLAAIVFIFKFMPHMQWTNVEWNKLPTEAQYRAKHPELCRDEDCQCIRCGGRKVLEFPLLSTTVTSKKAICLQCKTVLWRIEV